MEEQQLANNPFVQDLIGVRDAWATVNNDRRTIEKQKAEMEFQKRVPQLLAQSGASQEMSDLAGLGLQAGNTDAYRQLLEQSFKQPDPNKQPLGEQAAMLAQTFGVQDPAAVEVAAGLPKAQALSYFNSLRTAEDADEKIGLQKRSLSLGERAQGRLEARTISEQAKEFKKNIEGMQKKLTDEEVQLGKVRSAFDKGSLAGDAVIFNYIARAVAGEKGPLNEGDISRLLAKTGLKDATKIQQYFSGDASSQLSAPQRAAFKELIDVAEKGMNSYRDVQAANILKNAELLPDFSNSELGKKEKAKFAKDHGFEVTPEGFKKIVSNKKVAITPETPIADIANSIADPEARAEALDAIAQFKGKAVPDAVRKMIEQEALAQGK